MAMIGQIRAHDRRADNPHSGTAAGHPNQHLVEILGAAPLPMSGHPASPVVERKIYAPYKIAALLEVAVGHGISQVAVLSGTGLNAASLANPHQLTSIDDYLVASHNAIEAGLPMEAAYDVGARLHLSAYGLYGYALICSPTVRDVFDTAVRYHRLATPVVEVRWQKTSSHAIWEYRELLRERMTPAVRAFVLRQQMKITSTHMRDISATNLQPLEVRFAMPADSYLGIDAERLGCRCTYSASANQLVYPVSCLTLPTPFGNRLTNAWLDETCASLIDRAGAATTLSDEVRRYLMTGGERMPSMASVASRLGMTERTLRRKLAADNARYADIEDEARRRLALEHILKTNMTADAICWRVGFSETSNLRRAIKRWTGKTIAQLRAETT